MLFRSAVRRQQESDARALAEAAEEAKEKRIERVQQRAALRLGKRELSKGWQAWHDLYTEQKRKVRLLQGAGARLSRPKLVAALAHWESDWQAVMKLSASERQEAKLAAAEESRLPLRQS